MVEGAAADLAGLDVKRVEATVILTALLTIAAGIIGSHVELVLRVLIGKLVLHLHACMEVCSYI